MTKGRYNWATLITECEKGFVASGQFAILRMECDTVCLPEYLLWYLNRPEAQSHFKRIQCGTSIPNLTNENIGNYDIELPPMEVQLKIVRINALAKRQGELLKKLSKKRQRLALGICLELMNN